MRTEYRDAEIIIRKSIEEVLPDKAVRTVLVKRKESEKCICGIGWKSGMENEAHTCQEILGEHIKREVLFLQNMDMRKNRLINLTLLKRVTLYLITIQLTELKKLWTWIKILTEKGTILFFLLSGRRFLTI